MLKSSALYNSLRPPNELLRLYDVTILLTLRLQSLSCKLLGSGSAQIVAVLQLNWIFLERICTCDHVVSYYKSKREEVLRV